MKNETDFQFPLSRHTIDLVDLLTRAGYSNARARRAVLEALALAAGPVTPAELLDAARAGHAALGLVTVYRTLEILETLGVVRKLHLNEGCHSYVRSTVRADEQRAQSHYGQDDHGHHIICQECHRAVEFAGCDMEAVIAAVQTQTGFAVQDHWLEMFGLCPSCQEKQL